ncbi:hypothetical protein KEM52_000828 [Ascosphaera acerosa]|nr:hypothetical protein KEM52_000828 [Ascosphaera acerosa]
MDRKRPAACIHCHLRKVRCDARAVGIPCSNCRLARKDDCRIHEKKRRIPVRSILNPVPIRIAPPVSRPTAVSVAPQPRSIGAYVDSNAAVSFTSAGDANGNDSRPVTVTETATTTGQTPVEGLLPQFDSSARHNRNCTSRDGLHGAVSNGTSSGRSVRADETEGGPTLQESTTRDELKMRLIKIIDQEDQNSPAIQSGIRVIYVGQDMSNMSFLLRHQQMRASHGNGNEDVHHFPANEVPRQYYRKAFEQISQDALELPPRDLADELINAYFAHVNPGCPVVDEDLFMAQYRQAEGSGPSLLLMQAIFLVGAHICKPRPERDDLKETFYRRAKILFDARIERNRDIMVQAAMLLTWYSDPLDDDVTGNAHHWIGLAARIATGIGMHRNTALTRMVDGEKRTWRRVFWLLYCHDVMVSLMHGRPQALNLEDCDVLPLSAADFEGCGRRVQTDFIIHLTTLCTSISSIIRERFGLHVTTERRRVALLQADKALAHWSSMLPPHLCMTSTVSQSPDCWAAKLQLVYHNLLILLHRPHPRVDDYGPNDAEICIAAAGVIVATMEDLRRKDQLKYLWISSVNAMFTAMIQVRVELCFSNALLAMNALGRFNSAATSLKVLGEYWISAETVARVFLNSKRLQHDLQALRDHWPDGSSAMAAAGSPAEKPRWRSVPIDQDSGTVYSKTNGAAQSTASASAATDGNSDTSTANSTDRTARLLQGPDTGYWLPSSDHCRSQQSIGDGHTGQLTSSTVMLEQPPVTPGAPRIPSHHDYLTTTSSPPDWHQLFSFADGFASAGQYTSAGGAESSSVGVSGHVNGDDNGIGATAHVGIAFPTDLLPIEDATQFESEWRDLYLQESAVPEINDWLGTESAWMLG